MGMQEMHKRMSDGPAKIQNKAPLQNQVNHLPYIQEHGVDLGIKPKVAQYQGLQWAKEENEAQLQQQKDAEQKEHFHMAPSIPGDHDGKDDNANDADIELEPGIDRMSFNARQSV